MSKKLSNSRAKRAGRRSLDQHGSATSDDSQKETSRTGITKEAYECLYLPRHYGSHIPGKLP